MAKQEDQLRLLMSLFDRMYYCQTSL